MTSDPDKDPNAEDTNITVLNHLLDAELVNIGLVVGMGAMMESRLQLTFCALVGSKYAAVVAGGQDVAWLIDYSNALVKVRSDVSEGHRKAILDALAACKAANEKRRQLVHSLRFPQPDIARLDMTVLAVKGKRRTHKITTTSWKLSEIRGVAGAQARASHELLDAVRNALGPEALRLGEELRQEDDAQADG